MSTQESVSQATKLDLKRPSLFRVFLVNDDYTPMDFVVHVLELFFYMDHKSATHIMLEVHTKGRGVCGIFTHEIAETKVSLVNSYARQNEHPLLCGMEKT